MYCALEAFVTNNGTTIPSPVDIEQWKSNPPYQLNGCVRFSRVYTDSVGQRVSKVTANTKFGRVIRAVHQREWHLPPGLG